METVDAFWRRFLKDTGRNPDTRWFDCFHFEMNEPLANKLLALVLKGQKKATASSLYSFESLGLPVPRKGNLSIVTDWSGNPACVIETTNVTTLAFKDMTFEICRREGEDDCLESWKKGHKRFYEEEGRELGYTFSDDLPIVFEDFEVVYPLA